MRVVLILFFIVLSFNVQINAQTESDTIAVDSLEASIMLLSDSPSQEQNPIIPNTPTTPQAAAFNRLGDYQASNNYGVPDISVPLFEIDHHGYKIPLALHYEATPIKPGYNYDVTGFGWTLSGNSCVSRTIRDVADEDAGDSRFTLDRFRTLSGDERLYLDYENQNRLDRVNYQYDTYNIVLPSGRSIPFFMYMSNNVMTYHTMSQDSNVKITCNYSTMSSFTVTDENGVTYNFTLPERSMNSFQNDVNYDKNVSWLLTSINVPSKGTIYYQYTEPIVVNTQYILREPVITVFRLYDSWYEWPHTKRFNVKGYFQSQSPRYEMRLLKRIIYGPSTVDFKYLSDNKHMNEIVVSDSNKVVRKFTLDVHGLYDLPCWQLNSLVIKGTEHKDSLVYNFGYHSRIPGNYTDFWGNSCDAGPSWNDQYGNGINNHGLDDLGNFNLFFAKNEINIDSTLIREQLNRDGVLAQLLPRKDGEHTYYYKLKLQTTTNGDTRIPLAPERNGILQSITYPNGGSTHFNFENHKFPTVTAADGDVVLDRKRQRIIEGGGYRIESIINYTANGEVAGADYYRYGYTLNEAINQNMSLPLPDYFDIDNYTYNDTINHHLGYGEAVVDPNLFTFMSGFSYSMTATPNNPSAYGLGAPNEFRKMLLGYDSYFKDITNNQGIPMWWEVTFSANKFRSLLAGRRPVVYPEVTVYHGQPYDLSECKSKTVYRYNIYNYQYPDVNQNGNYFKSVFGTAPADTAYYEIMYFDPSYPALTCNELPADRHVLQNKTDYSYNAHTSKWEIVTKEEYNYKKLVIAKSGYVFESFISRENYYPNEDGYVYGQIGYFNPLLNVPLSSFYKPTIQSIGLSVLIGKSTTTFRHGGTVSNENTLTESYDYLCPGVLKSKHYTDVFKNEDLYSYVADDERDNDPVISAMKSRNMLASMLKTETTSYLYVIDTIAGSKLDYRFYGDRKLPSKMYKRNGNVYEESIEVLSYDDYANPTLVMNLKTGLKTLFLWDQSGRYLMAMVEGADTNESLDISDFQSCDSRGLHQALQNIFQNSQVQTWEYEALIGVKAHTDVSGNTTKYEYDELGRLQTEKRVVGNGTEEIIREYEYNYMNH